MIEALVELWRYRQLISLTLIGAKTTATLLAIQNADQQIDRLVDEYRKVKQLARVGIDKTEEVRSAVDAIIAFLNGTAWSTHKVAILPTANSALGYSLEMAEAQLARMELVKIYSLQADEKLPPDKVPWSRRRARLVNQRDALVRLALQLESAIRRTDRNIIEAQAAEEAIRQAAVDPIITKEEVTLLNDDWTEWVNTEGEAQEWKTRFEGALRVTKRTVEVLSKMIEAGDGAEKP